MIGTNDKRELWKSVLSAWFDDDNDDGYTYIYMSGAEMGLVLLVPGTTNNLVNVIQNGLKITH